MRPLCRHCSSLLLLIKVILFKIWWIAILQRRENLFPLPSLQNNRQTRLRRNQILQNWLSASLSLFLSHKYTHPLSLSLSLSLNRSLSLCHLWQLSRSLSGPDWPARAAGDSPLLPPPLLLLVTKRQRKQRIKKILRSWKTAKGLIRLFIITNGLRIGRYLVWNTKKINALQPN